MSALIKGLLIDPKNQTVTEVDILPDEDGCGHLESMYDHMDCECVDLVRNALDFLPSAPSDDLWINDDERSYSDCPYLFHLPGYVPLVGKALILGFNHNTSASVSHNLTVKDIAMLKFGIKWYVREIVN
jgi:hypothetical protein